MTLTEKQKEVYDLIASMDKPIAAIEVARILGCSREKVVGNLKMLLKKKVIKRESHKSYSSITGHLCYHYRAG